ncbi:MAG: DNA protecting protein DprA [Candidatus Doudnabacteria bacterium RIFCSPHIGHO2_01_FULL_46_24]|uniref:DNA protecting protein DprA n=1 Tax=Candidatus Doudnabacteria bacterium RIFCSPHIGHO2_01_FULL_46_24 TaxID=1817825 RepID=A0A1F5NT45_9BACT|nr:MAG: DNA protecting protein DprA [Candidatus Doudnabacteria bacterium RIFCSPHIGHO2_01_FULL_46_24]
MSHEVSNGINTENKVYGNALNSIEELGPVSLLKLLKFFGNFQNAWQAGVTDLAKAGLDQKKIDAILAKHPSLKPEQLWQETQRLGLEALLLGEKDYPKLLAEIPSPPPILYVRGNKKILNDNLLAVVGSRKMTGYGRRTVEDLIPQLLNAGLDVVSGLAFGVDACSLQTTLSAGSAPIAVLASPLDNSSISPRINYNLAQKIVQQGCMISEYALGSQVYKTNFPQRNRIIAGLSLGTLVIEADEKSGSLITANYALDFNREVFAVPGPIFSDVSRGTNALIKKGAVLVSSAADIIQALNLDVTLQMELDENYHDETGILDLLSEPKHIDELIRQLKLDAPTVSTNLTMLELKGRIKHVGGGTYAKIR